MKVFLISLLLGSATMLWTGQRSPHALSSEGVDSKCGASNSAFQPGEEIVYKIYYHLAPLWIPAGEVIFRVDDAGKDYRLSATAYTYKSYEWFYRGYYTFESRVDKKSLMPSLFLRNIEEKKYTRYNKFVFDHHNGKVSTWQGKNAREAALSVHDISPCMHDMLSIMYYVRNMNFHTMRKGETFPVEVFLEEKYPLNVRILDKNQEKRIKGLGKYMTHCFSPEVVAGEYFNDDTQMSVWVSADENKVPLLIESPVRVGKIKAVLLSHKGLRYPLQEN